jgi:transcriptional regulator with XRE-family HTH domain
MTNTDPVRSDGPNGKRRPNGEVQPGTYRNGPDLARARACVGPEDASTPCEPHWGSVPDSERERLAAGFGAELYRLRQVTGFSQARVGNLAGLRGDHVGRLERGQRRPSVAAVLALCRVLVPKEEREAAQESLAALAGESLRQGAARKKQAKDNKHRRKALAIAQRTAGKMRETIREKEARGELVAGDYRRLAEKLEAEVARLRADQRPEAATIKGRAPHDGRSRRPDKPRSRSMKDIEAWLDSHQQD